MSDGAFPDRLTQLRNRWENDPSSRIFLQLAEEYRHLGRVKEALEVLERGLKEHPGYLSALVAKGRCLLELNEPEGARGVLERVVKQDATQMVANKLLVRAYIETGDPAKARERLDLYSLLNDSDPEIDELRRRVRAMEQPPQAEPQRPAESHPARTQELMTPMNASRRVAAARGDVFDLSRPVGPPPSGGDLFDLDLPAPRTKAAPVPEAEPFAELWAPPATAAPAAVAFTADEKVAPVLEEPPKTEEAEPEDVIFPGLASRESRRRYLDHLGSEGLFLFERAPAESVEAPPVVAPPVSDLEPFQDLA
jgi:tetratricopeptide (TPR) repeat protein